MTSAGTRTVDTDLVLPLATTFTPPASCNDLTISSLSNLDTWKRPLSWYISGATGLTTTILDKGSVKAVMYDYGLDTACYPPGPIITTNSAYPYWSPGIICPSAWSGADTHVSNSETTVNCCPPSFSYASGGCLSTITADVSRSAVLYVNDKRIDKTPTLTSVSVQRIFATRVEIRYRDTDSTLFASLTASTGSPTPSTTAAALAASPGLSTGAKIGIGIGVPLAVIALGILGFLLFWRRRRRRLAAHASPDASKAEAPAMGPAPYDPDAPPQELPGAERGELAGSDPLGELVGSDARRELMGSDARRELAGNDAGGELAAGHYDVPNQGASEGYAPKLAVREVDAEKAVGFRGGPVQSAAELYPDHR